VNNGLVDIQNTGGIGFENVDKGCRDAGFVTAGGADENGLAQRGGFVFLADGNGNISMAGIVGSVLQSYKE